MSRTVCSWCKAPLVLKDDILVCSNTDCPACDEKYLHEELIRTRKALEWARHFLKEIRLRYLIEKDNPSRQNKWADTALYMYNCAESFFDDYDKTKG